MIFGVMIIFIVGVIFFFISHLAAQIYESLRETVTEPSYNNTVADATLDNLIAVETSRMWDFAFLFMFFGVFIVLAMTAFATRISPVFFWIYGIISLVVLMVAAILSNIWQEIAAAPEFAVTIQRFPIMDTLLGTFYPTVITGMIMFFVILLFGKTPEAGGGFR